MRSINEQPSEHSIYIWNICGSIVNALFSVVALMIVTRFLDDREADIFSIAWTISQLMATVGTFQIRVYQATDVQGTFVFWQYLIFRIVTVAAMILSSVGYIAVRGYTGEKALVVLIVCLFRAVDSLADVYEGWFQQKERLDLSGKALTYRVIFAATGFACGLILTKNLLFSCTLLLILYLICFFGYDIRYHVSVDRFRDPCDDRDRSGWFFRMFCEGLPLFINAFLIMSILNEPKMVIDTAIASGKMEAGIQTVFNILFMPASVLNLAYIVFRPMITQMAIVWNRGENQRFLKILGKIVAYLIGISVVLLAGSALLGIPVLSIVYAVDLSAYRKELLVIMVGGCIYTFAAVLDNVLVILRRQYILVIAYVLTWIYIKVSAGFFVETRGVMGASLAYSSAMSVYLLLTAGLFLFSYWRKTREA